MPTKRERLIDRAIKATDLVGISIGLKSKSGRSFKEKAVRISRNNLDYFSIEPQAAREGRHALEKEGFRVVAESRFGLSLLGEKGLVEKFFKTKFDLKTVEIKHGKKNLKMRMPTGSLHIPEKLSRVIDVANLEQFPVPLESSTPPDVDYYHLNVPDDISTLMGASGIHGCGYDGTGIRICMIDDGFFEHAYYTSMGYDITLVPVGTDTMPEGKGHGTAIASNALAVAPGAEFIFLNNQLWIFSVATAAFRTAKDENPDVITCSWGMRDYDPILAAEIVDAVVNGIVVTFACGNGGTVYFPGSMNEVISVGGAYPVEGGGFEASTYASSGEEGSNPGRQCPDVCGIVGNAPHGVLIMMPTVPDGYYDGEFAGEDATATDDGWICASGTSSAAPQVAGVAALMLQCEPVLTPEDVRTGLQDTATDIVVGNSASGEAAGIGVDLATGHGLVNAADALDALGCSCAPSCTRFDIAPCSISHEFCLIRRELDFCSIRYENFCNNYLIDWCRNRVTVPGCGRLVETHGCSPLHHGCGPVSLIMNDFRKGWREIDPILIKNPAIRNRLERLITTPIRGEHVRSLTARRKLRQPGAGIKTRLPSGRNPN